MGFADSKDVTPTIVEEEKDGEVKHVLQLPSQQGKLSHGI